MGNNVYQGQLRGPFEANTELYDLIVADAASEVLYVSHIGIQSAIENIVYLNDKEIHIGKTGIYEIGNVEITSIKFSNLNSLNEEVQIDNNTIIDYVIELK